VSEPVTFAKARSSCSWLHGRMTRDESSSSDAGKGRLEGRIAVSQRLGISLSTVDRLVKAGVLLPVRVGRRVLIRSRDVDGIVGGTRK
jgi:excisionase family DNA binding protein